MLMPVPETCTFEEAAAIPEAFATAYLNLFIEGGLKAGDTLLMHAGASGLASVVIPMAKAFGARVITTVIEDSVIDRIKHLGADRVVNSRKEDIVKVLEEERDAGHPIDVAIDCLGGSIQGKCLQYMRYGGRWIMIATLAGDITEVDLKKLYVLNVRLIGSTLRSKKPEFKAKLLAEDRHRRGSPDDLQGSAHHRSRGGACHPRARGECRQGCAESQITLTAGYGADRTAKMRIHGFSHSVLLHLYVEKHPERVLFFISNLLFAVLSAKKSLDV